MDLYLLSMKIYSAFLLNINLWNSADLTIPILTTYLQANDLWQMVQLSLHLMIFAIQI